MKYPSKEPFVIRTVYEDTYESYFDYWRDTSLYEKVGKVHTIWVKGKDPKNSTTSRKMTYLILHDACGDLTTIPGIELSEFSEEGLGDAVYNAVEALMVSRGTDDYSTEAALLASTELAIFRSVEKIGDLTVEEFIRSNAVMDFESHEYSLYLKLKEKFEPKPPTQPIL